MLIHGNSKNFSNKIRFAFNFGVIGASKLSGSDKKIDSRNHKYLSFDDQ